MRLLSCGCEATIYTGKTERMVFVAKNGLRSNLRVYDFQTLADVCLHTH